MSHIVLSQFVVRNSNGSIDTDATVTKFRTALNQFVADRESEEASIATAIESVLDNNMGNRTNLDFVTGSVARTLNATASTYNDIKNKAAEYIRANACGEKDGLPIDTKTNTVLASPRRYFLGKGRDGGVSRFADRVAAKAAKASK